MVAARDAELLVAPKLVLQNLYERQLEETELYAEKKKADRLDKELRAIQEEMNRK
jgi:hypothetical protein